MKKILLFGAALMMAAVSMAQTPTVSASSVTFKYCQTTEGTAVKQIGLSDFPFHWLGETFTTYGSKVVILTNARGCDSLVTLTVAPMEGVLPYAFSVSSTKKVYFSKGNLQYCANPLSGPKTHETLDGENIQGIWRFAEHQWDRIREGGTSSTVTYGNNVKCSNADRSSSYSGWVDLFKFGTSGYKGLMPWTTTYFIYNSANYSSYSSTREYEKTPIDWGWYNAISNGGDQPGVWFTLSRGEWEYLWAHSTHGKAKINGIDGTIYLPDNWECPDGVTFVAGNTLTTYSLDVWAQMEARGALFVCQSGTGSGASDSMWSGMTNNNFSGYWLSTRSTYYSNEAIYWRSYDTSTDYYDYPYIFRAVRLVREADK